MAIYFSAHVEENANESQVHKLSFKPMEGCKREASGTWKINNTQ